MFRFLFRKLITPSSKMNRSRPARFTRSRFNFDASQLPQGLGILAGVPLQETVARLQRAIPLDYVERLKYRVLSEHPKMTEDEFACKWFELQRFFLMSVILKQTPMFSSEIDAVWHEMLMFTREYQRFGDMFTGSVIHHAPEREPKQMPGERAWFDWIYAHLFEFAPSSAACWNGFFRHPLDTERTNLLREGNEAEIAKLLFHTEQAERHPDVEETIRLLVKQAIDEARHAEQRSSFEETEWSQSSSGSHGMLQLAGAMMFFSIMDSSNYGGLMDSVLPDRKRDNDSGANCSTSGCSGSDGGWDGSGDSGSDGNGGSSGDGGSGSSCSTSSGCSSGSSCSSSSSCSSGSSCGSSD